VFHPSWSPDGTRLSLVCYGKDDSSSLSVLDLKSMALTRIATVAYPFFMDNPSSWSPDGTSIAFDVVHWDPSDTFLDGSHVAVVPAAGGPVRQLTTMDTFMAHPSWRPDGTELVMNSYDIANGSDLDVPSNLYSIKPDGSGQVQITKSSVDGTMRIGLPKWDSDGSRIVVAVMTFSAGDHVLETVHLGFVDAAGGEPALISTFFNGKYPDIRPTP
jgi:Tol biopolymer transport system component